MKKKFYVLVLIVSLGINVGFLLRCFWPHCPWVKKSAVAAHGWHSSSLRRHLDLSAKQAQLMEAERRNVMAQAQPLQEKLRQKRRELFTMLKSKAVPASELDMTLDEIARLQAGIEKLYILHALKVKGFLSPAQLRKYDGFFEREFCPGMIPGQGCGPGEMARTGQGVPGCETSCDPKK